MELKVSQLNAIRSNNVASEIRNLFARGRLDILCVQEPYPYNGNVCGLKSAAVNVYSPADAAPLVAIVARSGIDCFLTGYTSSAHSMVLEIQYEKLKFYIVNMYCQFSLPYERFMTELEHILTMVQGQEALITMDANAKSSCWFSSSANDNGRRLEELILAQDL